MIRTSVVFVFSSLILCTIVNAADKPRVYITASETVDASNSRDKAKHVDFGTALSAALTKKSVPVLMVTDPAKSEWTNQECLITEGRQYRNQGCEDGSPGSV